LPAPVPYNEKELIKGLSGGDELAFRQIFDAYLEPLCFFAKKLIGVQEEAEDLVSTSFFRLWERHSSFSTLNGVRSFLYTTVKNLCLNVIKHRQVVNSAQRQLSNASDTSENYIEYRVLQAELLRLINDEMRSLPGRHRQILEWNFLEELSTAEIAGRLQLTESHVRMEKSRALVNLRAALKRKRLLEVSILLLHLWQMNQR